jgi:hypothetical protein
MFEDFNKSKNCDSKKDLTELEMYKESKSDSNRGAIAKYFMYK